ncbi:type II toxin-antitoxin system Phd/YefM family antitoxin [Actinomadura madurae]|uniref:type II toxin-antitoxin system Phd/YefM family antitoxin n=2 Tax=Actinomadura madurae TaxID=1993 RepID=UPI0020D25065|nr:type II toxin-antitoxin system prevent-host-death family antitoxin [Actinomadura madurae]MCP9951867.1 type II toxin-antitoxin system prevent-host-death family antitoxin [Actinomadura madurae]MCQ0007389.1 type II toxin-antitoxin system prevent-host-death family antitoxin [Actinomadura madurae]
MHPMSASEFRSNLAAALDRVTEDLDEIIVTRPNRDAAIVISLSEYESLKETAFLLGTPANARHLAASIESLRGGGAQPHELIEDDDQEVE